MARLFYWCLLAATAWPALHAQAAEPKLGDVLRAIELHYNRLASFETDFEQQLSYAGRSRPAERGRLSLLRPGRMRWDYSRPAGKLLVGDGERLKLYNPYTNQVRTVLLDQSADLRAPLSFLLGRLDFSRQFRELRFETIDDVRVLVGRGRTGREAYDRVEFSYEPDEDYRFSALKVHGRDGSITDFRFSAEQTNRPLEADLFRFEAPSGAEILPETSLGKNQ